MIRALSWVLRRPDILARIRWFAEVLWIADLACAKCEEVWVIDEAIQRRGRRQLYVLPVVLNSFPFSRRFDRIVAISTDL